MTILQPTTISNGTATWANKCRVCNGVHTVTAAMSALRKYNEGALVQDAFPGLDGPEREILMTGIGPDCYNTIFGDPDAEDEDIIVDVNREDLRALVGYVQHRLRGEPPDHGDSVILDLRVALGALVSALAEADAALPNVTVVREDLSKALTYTHRNITDVATEPFVRAIERLDVLVKENPE